MTLEERVTKLETRVNAARVSLTLLAIAFIAHLFIPAT